MKEEDNLIQATDPRGLPQCDQLHAADRALANFTAEFHARAEADSLRSRVEGLQRRAAEFEEALYRVAFGERDGDGRLIRFYSAEECAKIAAAAVNGGAQITFGDLRRARSVLSEKQT